MMPGQLIRVESVAKGEGAAAGRKGFAPFSGPNREPNPNGTSRFRSTPKAPTGIEPVYTALQAAA